MGSVAPEAPEVAEGCAGERVNPRVERSQRAILAATVELLAEHGVAGLAVDQVAARAGVGKATVYRHWPSRAHLVMAALETILVDHPVPETGSLRGDLRACLGYVVDVCTTPPLSRIMPSLLDASERDPELAELHGEFTKRRRKTVHVVLERAAERGLLRPGLDHDLAADLVAGPVFYRRLVRRVTPDAAYVEALLDAVLPALEA